MSNPSVPVFTRVTSPFLSALIALVPLGLTACITDPIDDDPEVGQTAQSLDAEDLRLDVFVADNVATKNRVVALHRDGNGSLRHVGTFPTGGRGTGAGLGSQGSVVLNRAGDQLYVVNAGSDELSVFDVRDEVLVLRDLVSSGGANPVSVTVRGGLVYVVNAGRGAVAGNITGFAVSGGQLSPIAGSTQPLSGAAVGPAQIELDPSGRVLVVTEKGTNNLTTYLVDASGAAGPPRVTASHGQTPFGFEFDAGGTLIVSEAFGGAPGASALSSYRLDGNGLPVLISGSIATGQTAACWVAISAGGSFAYTTNTASNSISGYELSPTGRLRRFADGGVTATTGAGPIDFDFGAGGRYLYTLNAGGDSITIDRARSDGQLDDRGTFTGLPASTIGLAAR